MLISATGLMATETLLISGRQIQTLLSAKECIAAVEEILKLRALGLVSSPGILGIHAHNGAFHIKAGTAKLNSNYFVSKTNANFPDNPKTSGLPTIQGIVVVSDADNGRLLALMDSMELTIIRTGAATAVATKHLSRANAQTLLVCGCGNQGRISIECIAQVRALKKIYLYDIDEHKAVQLARDISKRLQIDTTSVDTAGKYSRQCDIIVTCTPSKKSILKRENVSPGTFVAAVGSDHEDKQEIDPAILKESKVVTDSTDQCANIGELHHAIEKGFMRKTDVYGELGEIIAGSKKGRNSETEITLFDSTGTALQDVAAAAIVYEKARSTRVLKINFAE